MILSNCSALLKGILIFPFPFVVMLICTFVSKKCERWLRRSSYSAGSLVADLIVFLPDCMSSPDFRRWASLWSREDCSVL